MYKRVQLVALIIFIFFTGIVFADSNPNMKEGLWEITTNVEMPGMPMSMPPVTNTQCLKKNALIPQSGQPGQECQFKNLKIMGNTITYEIDCTTQNGKMIGHGKITYNGTSMEGEMVTTISQGNMKMIQKISGHYVGKCK